MGSITEAEHKRWKSVCHNGLHNGADLKDSETEFLKDMEARLLKYGVQSYVSDKQELWLETIEVKLQTQLGPEYENNA